MRSVNELIGKQLADEQDLIQAEQDQIDAIKRQIKEALCR